MQLFNSATVAVKAIQAKNETQTTGIHVAVKLYYGH